MLKHEATANLKNKVTSQFEFEPRGRILKYTEVVELNKF